MQDQERIKTLYAVITGHRYEKDKNTLSLKSEDVWRSASLLAHQLALTHEQLSTLLLLKFGDVTEESLARDAEEAPKVKGKAQASLEQNETVMLESGIIPWTAVIDGVPVKWMLNYNQAHLPARRGDCISFQGHQYRIS